MLCNILQYPLVLEASMTGWLTSLTLNYYTLISMVMGSNPTVRIGITPPNHGIHRILPWFEAINRSGIVFRVYNPKT